MLQYFFLVGVCVAIPTTVTLQNAAKPGTEMPVVGLGTGYYTSVSERTIEDSVAEWLKMGGKRIDGAVTYKAQAGVGKGIAKSKVARKDIFITSKIGPTDALGYSETLQQFQTVTQQLRTDYVDLLLIHWPANEFSNEPVPNCYVGHSTYANCRQETWKALMELYNNGSAKAIGVSNFETEHLMDIFAMNITQDMWPSVNQIENNIYWHEPELRRFCEARKILLNGYAPLGTPDYMKGKWTVPALEHPTVVSIAKKMNKKPSQILLRWQTQQNIVVNPRTKVGEHMKENLDIFNFTLTAADMWALTSIPVPPTPQPYKVCPNPQTLS